MSARSALALSARVGAPLFLLLALASTTGCAPAPSSPALSLVSSFGEATVSDSPTVERDFPRLEWRFDGDATVPPPEEGGATFGWRALHDVEGLAVTNGNLRGRAGERALFAVAIPEDALPEDDLHEVQIRMRAAAGARLGVDFFYDEEIDLEELLDNFDESYYSDLMKELEPGEELRTYTLSERDSPWSWVPVLSRVRHLGLRIEGGDGSDFELESVRLVTRTEHLATVPSGIGWHQLAAGISRETIVARSPERLAWNLDLGERPWLDVAIGTPEVHPLTFRVAVDDGSDAPLVVERTVSADDRWEPVAIDLERFARRAVGLELSIVAEDPARVGFWGAPTIRHRGASTAVVEPSPARARLARTEPPRGIVLILGDTLRRDHLDAWGYERETAPTLTRLAAQGTRFADNISQGTWTKVSVPAILSSLYASSHGIYDIPHRLPASVTTLSEALRDAGYATFHTSSVPFTGRNSNLQQGVEVLHERSSADPPEGYDSKTARVFVDRLLPWLETHRDQPFFVFLHVFDPHSPYRPQSPWDRRWLDDERIAEHEAALEKLEENVDIFHGLPRLDQLEEAGIAPEAFTQAEQAWYDASIRAMDVEIARLIERLDELGLRDDTLIAFVSDHGEEFREHGYPWHGHSVYGEMINVPLFLHWPGVVPSGLVVEETTQSIDLMPTLLELARVPVPEQAQGRSLLPLIVSPDDPGSLGWSGGPVFSERREAPGDKIDGTPDAFTVIADGWKLIWNVELRDDRGEYELFDHRADPLNLDDVAVEHPEKVSELRRAIEQWRERVEAEKVDDAGLAEELSPEELEELRALGYVD